MSEQDSTVGGVNWKRVFPWLILFRAFSISITAQVLVLATLGSTLVPLGWRFSQLLFVSQEEDMDVQGETRDEDFIGLVNNLRRLPGQPRTISFDSGSTSDLAASASWSSRVLKTFWAREISDPIVQPVAAVLLPQQFLRRRVYLLFGSLWTLFVWGIIAGMICRIAVVRMAQDERLTLWETFVFSRRRWHSHSLAPLFPLAGLVLVAAMVTLFSLPLRMGTWYGVVLGLFWLPVLVGGCLMAVLKIGLLFGWPLMWPAVATEETGDVFEATSRSFSYTFQRPLHYLGYALLVGVVGVLAVTLVQIFTDSVLELSAWAAAAGGGKVWSELTVDTLGGYMIRFGDGVVRAVGAGFSHGFFWASVAGIYLLLRQNVDHRPLEEVYLEDEKTRYGLPDLDLDPKPGVDEKDPPAKPADTSAETPADASEASGKESTDQTADEAPGSSDSSSDEDV